MYMKVLLTIIVGAAVGMLFLRLKVPAGMLVGALLGVTVLNIAFDVAQVPSVMKTISQGIAGAYVGSSVDRNDLIRLKIIAKPFSLVIASFFLLNLIMGFVIHHLGHVDLLTSFMACVPGGGSDIALVTSDLGGDPAIVAIFHFVRSVTVLTMFPTIVIWLDRRRMKRQGKSESEEQPGKRPDASVHKESPKKKGSFGLTAGVTVVFTILGKVVGIPAGPLLFSMASVLALKLFTEKAYLPLWSKRAGQILSGCFIGSGIHQSDMPKLYMLLIPIILMLIAVLVNFIIVGHILYRKFNYGYRESLLMSMPGGASEMAFIAPDLGVYGADVVVMQVTRLLIVLSIFPPIFSAIVSVLS